MRNLLIFISLSWASLQGVAQGDISFSADVTSGCAPLEVHLQNTSADSSAINFEWDLDDGSFESGSEVVYTYNVGGSFLVTMTAYDEGWSYLGSSQLTIEVEGLGDITASTTEPCVGESVAFLAPSGGIDYTWDFGDGGTASGAEVNYQFESAGTFTVTLSGTFGDCGSQSNTIEIVTGEGSLPEPDFQLSANTACPGDEIAFSTLTVAESYLWDFGDGTTSSEQNVRHAYSELGDYKVTLTIINQCELEGSTSKSVSIGSSSNWPSDISLDVSSSVACPNQPLVFTADAGNYTYVFDFGDENSTSESEKRRIEHAYESEGVYDVSVTYFNQCAADTTVTITVNISTENSFPTALEFKADKSELCPGATAKFNATTGYEWYVWDYGDGSSQDSTKLNTAAHAFEEGNYQPTVKVYSACGGDSTLSLQLVVSTDAELIDEALTLTHVEASCPKSSVEFFASAGYDKYEWDFGDGSDLVETFDYNLSHFFEANGAYDVAVTIYNFCGDSQTVHSTLSVDDDINLPEGIELSSSVSKTCPNDDIQLFVDGGYAGYVWFVDGTQVDSTKESTYTTRITEIGTAVLSVKIYNACGKSTTLETSVEITNELPFDEKVSLSAPGEACPNETITFQSTRGFKSYFWDFGDGTSTKGGSTIQHTYNKLGDYEVNLTVTNSCGTDSTLTVSAKVTANSPIGEGTTLLKNKEQTCPNETVTFNASKGFVKYVWNFGDGSDAIETSTNSISYAFTQIGEYAVSVQVFNACSNSKTLNIVHETSTASSFSGFLSISNTPTSVCPGENITLSGPNNYRNYRWDFGDGNTAADSVASQANHVYTSEGVYEVSLTFQNVCGADTTITKELEISANAPFDPSIKMNVDKEQACPGEYFRFSAPIGYENYQWDFSVESDSSLYNRKGEVDFAFAELGTYDVTVFFMNSCGNDTSLVQTVVVGNDVGVLQGVFVDIKDQVCPGENVAFSAKSGFAKYYWDFGDGSKDTTTTSKLTHIYEEAGGYEFSLVIENSCGADSLLSSFVSIDASIKQDHIFIEGPESVCPGEEIFLTATEGFTTYEWKVNNQSYSTDNGFLGFSIDSVGAYEVSLTMYNACGTDTTIVSSVEVGNANSGFDDFLSLNANYKEICPGDEAIVNVEGVGLKSFLWRINDGESFRGSSAITVSFEETGEQVIHVTTSNFCGADTTMSIQLIVTTGGKSDRQINLTSTTEVACPGEVIGFTASSGFSSYKWLFGDGSSKVSTSAVVSHAYQAVGNYPVSVTVTDNCGNSFKRTLVMDVTGQKEFGEGVALQFDKSKVCPGEKINFGVSGLGNDYRFEWTVQDTTYTSQRPSSSWVFDQIGNYEIQVLVTDLCGNQLSLFNSVVVGTDAKIPFVVFGIKGDEQLAGCPGDFITFFFQGEYQNTWDFGDGVQLSASEVVADDNGTRNTVIQYKYAEAGTYDVTLYLENQCGAKDTLTTEVVVGGSVAGETSLTFSQPDSEVGYARCAPLTLKASGGSSFIWDFGDGTESSTSSTTVTHSYDEAGVYEIRVAITNGCGLTSTETATISIANQALPSVEVVSQTEPQCEADTSGYLEVKASGFGPFTYTWTGENEGSGTSLSGLTAGEYSIVVSDRFGCSTAATFDLNAEGSIALSETVTDASCGEANGSILLGLEQPEDYSLLWSDGSTAIDRTSLAFGEYGVTITQNATGCQFEKRYQIGENALFEVSANITAVSCFGNSDGAINVDVSDNTGVTFLWSSGQTTPSISDLSIGKYQLTITDENGCRQVRTYEVSQPSAIHLEIDKTNASCAGDPGNATVKVSGGNGSYTYLWSDGNTGRSNASLTVGTHNVTVTDSGGCSESISVEIDQAPGFEVSADVVNNLCGGDENGSISLVISGGIAPYSYSWNSGESIKELSGLSDGVYEVLVTDQLGCTVTKSITISTRDTVLPVAMVRDVVISLDQNGEVTITPEMLDSGSSDNCSIAQMSLNRSSFSCADVGINRLTFSVEDGAGNVARASVKVEIIDDTAPEIITKSIEVYLDETGKVEIVAEDVNNGSTDACGIESLNINKSMFDCSDIGSSEIVLTGKDANGNSTNATSIITVIDEIAPVVVTRDITVEINRGEAVIQAADIDGGSSDACGINSLSLDISTFGCEDIGSVREVVLTVEDNNGNSSSGIASITVTDNASGTGCQPLTSIDKTLRIYPNPAVNSVFVESDKTGLVKVYNISGILMMEGITNETIDVTALPVGIYLIEVNGAKFKLKKQ